VPQDGTPLVVLAGREYGTGSSRDWAAKGARLLGVRALVARSSERIQGANLGAWGCCRCSGRTACTAARSASTGRRASTCPWGRGRGASPGHRRLMPSMAMRPASKGVARSMTSTVA